MTRILLTTATAIAALLLFAACDDDEETTNGDVTASPTDAATDGPTFTPFPNVCQTNPDPATPEFQVLNEPDPDSEVTSPLTISGEVNYFEATYQVALYDGNGDPIAEDFGTALAEEVGELAPFTHDLEFSVGEPTPACLWVYESSAQDGSPINVGQVPLTLLP